MGRKSTPGNGTGDWTLRDEALWTTAEIAALVKQGRLAERWPIAVPFALRLGTDENALCHGPFALFTFSSPGDGSYDHNGSSVFATGRGAIPLMVGHAIGQGMGNAARRRQAMALAQPRWMQIDSGTLTVSTHGFYLHTPHAIHSWDWGSIHSATLTAPGSLKLMGNSLDGPVNWLLNCDWAELVFFLWAITLAPGHPQLSDRTWLPGEWLTKAFIHAQTSQGQYPGPDDFTQLSRALGMA